MMRRRLRVLLLVESISPTGGAERVAATLATCLDPNRFERILCATRAIRAPELAEAARAAGATVIALGRRATLDLGAWRPLLRFLREHPVDVVHAHMFGSNVWGTLLGRLVRAPVIIAHEHTWSYEGQPLRRVTDRELIARLASAVIAVSNEDRRRMIEVEGIDPARIRVVRNGIPPLIPSGRDVRAEIGLSPATPVIGTVSVLRPQKALEVLIEATALLRRTLPDVHVLVAGDGPEAGRLRSRAKELGVEGAIHFLGRRTDVPDLLRALDVAVLSSDYEGLPLSVIEYMAAGLPVVATRVGGVPELVEHGANGLLVERRDPAALARAVAELLADPKRRARMGAAGRERQQREFSLETFISRVESLYEELWRASHRTFP